MSSNESSNESFWPTAPLTYGITPPKLSFSEEQRLKTAASQVKRISALPVDALVIYDRQDESSRTDAKRPFPFMKAVDPLEYAVDYLGQIPHKKVIYRSVSNMTAEDLSKWLGRVRAAEAAAVLVGAPSTSQSVQLGLGNAYRTRLDCAPDVPLGGVAIAERHQIRGGEDERVLKKEANGCSFFISQAVYSVSESKTFLSDLHYRCQALGQPVPPVFVTLSPCGSLKTLEFLNWLGVSVPGWLRNELMHANDILSTSVDLSIGIFEDLLDFAREKSIPLGCNVESVSLQRAEIEASVEMVERVAGVLGRG